MKTQTKFHAIFMALLFTGVFLSQTAQAGSLTCTGIKNADKPNPQLITATLGEASACEGLFEGKLAQFENGAKADLPLGAFGMEWDLIQKDVRVGDTGGALSIEGGGKNGTWSIDTSLTSPYNTFVVGLKLGNMHGYWDVGSVLSGTYSGLTNALSHANLYGKTTVIPVPAALWLFGSGMIGLIGVARRKSANAVNPGRGDSLQKAQGNLPI